jgi:tetratricopeptide (TPR) repeat protein
MSMRVPSNELKLTLPEATKRAVAAYERGHLREANRLARAILSVNADYFDALHLIAAISARRGRFSEALASYDRALAVRPNSAEALNNRGVTLYELKRLDEALASYNRALAAWPDYAEALNNRGVTLFELKRLEEALASYDRALAVRPSFAGALYNRGNTLKELQQFTEALASYDQALAVQPDYAEALNNRGTALKELKRFDEALASYDRALALRPDYAEVVNNRGVTLYELKRLEEALASYDLALAVRPDFAEAVNNRGKVLQELGQLREAQAAYLKALRLDPNIAGVYINLADLITFQKGDRHLVAMEALAAKTERLSKADRMQLDFALGKAYADLHDYTRSFQHLLAGNAAKRATICYDESMTFAFFDKIEAIFTRELIAQKAGNGEPSALPIFVIGMPRSGTTLVEQIIASHPQVHGAGELQTFNDVILSLGGADGHTIAYPEFVPSLDGAAFRQVGARYVAELRALATNAGQMDSAFVTDKMPSNYYFVGLIHLALSNAKIVHVVREPIDTCVSCFSRLFSSEQDYTYNLGELGRYYRRYEQLMAHWRAVLPAGRIHEVRYEDVVADLEGQARRIIAYCGLPWNDLCLSFHENSRPIRTASAAQVRQPIYQGAVGRWRVYQGHLGPLLTALGIETAVV